MTLSSSPFTGIPISQLFIEQPFLRTGTYQKRIYRQRYKEGTTARRVGEAEWQYRQAPCPQATRRLENDYTVEVLSKECEVWAPLQAPRKLRKILLKGSHKTSHVPGPRAEPVIWKKPGSGLPAYLRKPPEHRWEATEFHPGTQTLHWWKSFWGVHSTTWTLIQERFWSLPSSLLNLRTQPCLYPIASSGTPQIKELTGCGKAPPTSREAALRTP